MYISDYHIHSVCSPAGHSSMYEIAEKAASSGLNEICYTDNCSLINEKLEIKKSWSWQELEKQFFNALIHFGSNLQLRFGIELDGVRSNTSLADSVTSYENLDFVIFSVHRLSGIGDISSIKFENETQCLNLISLYLTELENSLDICNFDVIGHLTYPLRYIDPRDDLNVDFSPFKDRITGIFKKIIYAGRGIELNVSNLRTGGQTMPNLELLDIYKSCGGEIITIGSGSHTSKEVGSNTDRALDLLSYRGFNYYTVYNHRRPQFIKI